MYFSLFSSTSQFGHDGGYQSVGDVFKNGGTYAIVGYLTVSCSFRTATDGRNCSCTVCPCHKR